MENVLLYQFTSDQLAECLSDKILPRLNELMGNQGKPVDEAKYDTRKDAAAFLRISLPTLGEYTKNGILTGYRIGSRVLYKRHELESALKQIQSVKPH